MVHVKEKDPPDDLEPVDWLLLTSEPIDSDEQILEVVDVYRARSVTKGIRPSRPPCRTLRPARTFQRGPKPKPNS